MRNYGITASDILAAIRENRNAFRFWTARKMDGIAQSHAENISDLRIMLLQVRFPNHPAIPFLAFGEGFSPVIVVTPDNGSDDNSENGENNGENVTDSDKELVTA